MNGEMEQQLTAEEIQRIRVLQIEDALHSIEKIDQIVTSVYAAIERAILIETGEQVNPTPSDVNNPFIGMKRDTLLYIGSGLNTHLDVQLMSIGRDIVAAARHSQDSEMTLTLNVPIEDHTIGEDKC